MLMKFMIIWMDPYSIDDLLKAHSVMERGLLNEAGEFRSRPVGVADSEGNISSRNFATNMCLSCSRFEWTGKIHLLIKSCVFHYEFELIHPFADGNGRMGEVGGIRSCFRNGTYICMVADRNW